ncbi:GNAT family N-acetyltransferase [Natronococcus sp. JC468]|uniref:GNAT family N-acetyltransferase n=1 Tax=Natronococcus sp. JC468 TaxID=1961921 RepID=UPI0014389A55|nr:GNAT family protein [Natronococcus sp. JC468]NKE34252.1 GNAT family N-acetyltransferase [Natronococcus sp. JC468]
MPGPAFLTGDDVTLRTIEEEDLEFLQAQVNDPAIRRPIGRSMPLNAEQERAFYDDVVCSDDAIHLLVVADATPVGTVGLDAIDWQSAGAELGYWIAPAHQRRGYGTEAVELVVGHGFDQLGLHRLAARVYGFNDGSKRLLESVGFSEEGVHRDAAFVDGEYRDTHWYGLLEEEWR